MDVSGEKKREKSGGLSRMIKNKKGMRKYAYLFLLKYGLPESPLFASIREEGKAKSKE